MEVIPSIDLLDGGVVRLEQGDYERATRFDREPSELVRAFVEAGVPRIHVVDLEGARAGTGRNVAIVKTILRVAGPDTRPTSTIRPPSIPTSPSNAPCARHRRASAFRSKSSPKSWRTERSNSALKR